ncbi:MAG: hypothetical protein ACLUBL_03525 [Fusobacterium sp.]|uniref:hypothetical protein n=2 Tax=Fusobacterium sp. TaxID=68766 RepID=UPI003991A3E4
MFIILIIFVIFIFFIKYGNNKTKINNMTEKIKENNEIEIVTEEVKTYFKDNFYDKNIENKSLYESVEKYLDKINDLKSNFNETFLPYNYTKLIAKKNEQNIKEYYECIEKIISLINSYNYKTREKLPDYLKYEVGEFYIYNMAQCYYYQKKFYEAEKVFEFGFENIELFDTNHNLRKSYTNFIIELLKAKKIELFFNSINIISKNINFDDEFVEEISVEISDLLETKTFFIQFTNYLKNINTENSIIKEIILYVEKDIKIYKNINYAEVSFKGKDYEKAKKYFEIAIENADKLEEDIESFYEVYGDILYKLKEYQKSIEVYIKSESQFNNHRVHCKIGDCYKMNKEYDKSFYSYLLSLYLKDDYKTAQTKLISISKKVNKDIDINNVIKFLKNNKDKNFEEIKKII